MFVTVCIEPSQNRGAVGAPPAFDRQSYPCTFARANANDSSQELNSQHPSSALGWTTVVPDASVRLTGISHTRVVLSVLSTPQRSRGTGKGGVCTTVDYKLEDPFTCSLHDNPALVEKSTFVS